MKEQIFFQLLNARCEELGLFNAREVAQRIAAIQPAVAKIDLARSVRNWQSGNSLPRPDFYRLILEALEVEEDMARSAWHVAYNKAKRARKSGNNHEAAAEGSATEGNAFGAKSQISGDRSLSATTGSGSKRQDERTWSDRLSARFPVILGGTLIAAFTGATAFISVDGTPTSGQKCDAAAGARWDPDRNTEFAPVDFDELRVGAIEICADAIRNQPESGRYWFQLGRAHEQRARFTGEYSEALRAFSRAHQNGHRAATMSLGMLYAHGKGLSAQPDESGQPDYREAAKMYALAADHGFAMGQYCHALSVLSGWSGAPPDPANALSYAERAVSGGVLRAAILVSELKAGTPVTMQPDCAAVPALEPAPQHNDM